VVIFYSVEFSLLTLTIRLFFPPLDIDNQRRLAQKKFALLVMVLFTVSIVLNTFHLLDQITLQVYVFIQALLLLSVNTLCLIFIKKFILRVFPDQITGDRDEEHFARLCKQFNISKREQEIIHLICSGMSNREIEKELYISLLTVKDHVSNIYRKTGVRNRVQLNNMFRYSGKNYS
jgi:DNA-binding CsgD family transcriptional regulator